MLKSLSVTFTPGAGLVAEQLPLALNDQPSPKKPSSAAQRWRADIWRQYGELMRHAPIEQQHALAEAVEEITAGRPDYARMRKGSVHCPAPVHDLNREDLFRLRHALRRIRRDEGPRLPEELAKRTGAKRFPKGLGDALETLIAFALTKKRVFPSLRCLAERAYHMAVDTVLFCLRVLEYYGLVSIIRRRKRVMTPLGFEMEVQDSNAYQLHVPGRDPAPVKKAAENPRQASGSTISPPSTKSHQHMISSSLGADSEVARGGAGATKPSASGEAAKEAAGELSLPAAPPRPIISAELAALVARWRR